MTVDLSEAEWNAVLNLIAMGPWREANPLLMKIGEQLQVQKQSRVNVVSGSQPGLTDGKREVNHG